MNALHGSCNCGKVKYEIRGAPRGLPQHPEYFA